MNLLQMSRLYHSRPSKILGIDDEYTAYCLDEACAFIISKIDNETMSTKLVKNNQAKKKESKKVEKKRTRMLPSEIYKKYEQ